MRRHAATFGTGYQVQFGVENSTGGVCTCLQKTTISLTPNAGFMTSSVTYTVGTANDLSLGQDAGDSTGWIRSIGLNDEVLFDDVRLDARRTGLALVAETLTDSWDDSLPTGCPGAEAIDNLIVGPGPNDATGD